MERTTGWKKKKKVQTVIGSVLRIHGMDRA